MNTEFPKPKDQFLKPSMFQDQKISLVYKGWEKRGNEDTEIKGVKTSWKQRLKYMLRYSFPEFAVDEANEPILDDHGKPMRNSNYDEKYPKGYAIVYHFEEGRLESGSLPLWRAFCFLNPKEGDILTIFKTGKDKETKWSVRKAGLTETKLTPNFSDPEFSGDPDSQDLQDEVPF